MKNSSIVINSDIRSILQENNINLTEGVSYLLLLYYELKPNFIPEELGRKILSLGIVNKDYNTNTIKWLIPLFEEGEVGFEWLTEWMDLFKKINPERRGIKVDVTRRMKKFFANNPSVRKEDVFKATEIYLKSTNPQYIKKSHKFIYEQDNSSMLKEYVDKLEDEKPVENNFNGLI